MQVIALNDLLFWPTFLLIAASALVFVWQGPPVKTVILLSVSVVGLLTLGTMRLVRGATLLTALDYREMGDAVLLGAGFGLLLAALVGATRWLAGRLRSDSTISIHQAFPKPAPQIVTIENKGDGLPVVSRTPLNGDNPG